MMEKETHGSWIQRLPRVPMDRWLPQKYNSRTTLMVIAVFTGTMLLLHTSGTMHSPAALSDHFNRIRSSAYNQFKNVFNSRDEDAIEPLSSTYCSPACPCACRPWLGPHDADPLEPTVTNCGRTADRRGRHQNVLAYTYSGINATTYLDGMGKSAMKALGLYPGWKMRVYYNGRDSSPAWNKTVCEVICRFPQVDFCDVRHLPGLGDISNQTATVWRFAVIADESVDRFLMRDLDSILIQRERDAVDEWLQSNKTFHVMRDHPTHTAPIIAGMWGGWNRYNEKYRVVRRKMFEAVNPTGEPQWDQWLLATILWPELLRTDDVMTHDSYSCRHYPHTRPFPKRRKNKAAFIGSRYANTNDTLRWKCPNACRPHEHRDWKYC